MVVTSVSLKGMFAHGIIPTNAHNVTIFYEEPDDDKLDWWVYLLIAIAAVCLLCCICGLGVKKYLVLVVNNDRPHWNLL
jgi:hypothetical protein